MVANSGHLEIVSGSADCLKHENTHAHDDSSTV
jgi:hypothetical protein